MPSPYTAATAATSTALAYSPQRHIEALCDGSLISAYQSAANTISLTQITSPTSTPTFTTLAQTFSITSGTNTIGDLFVSNNGTTTSDVWLAYSDNSSHSGLFIAHGTYTAAGGTWSWDNTGTSIPVGAFTGGFMVPSLVWTGTNLIIAMRANGGNYGVSLTYTTTLNGTTGWATLATLDGGNSSSHCYPLLRHDATNGCTLCVYTLAGDTVYARVLADSAASPAVANWSARVALSGTVNVGAANLSAVLDPASSRLHVTYMNTGVSTNPQYVASTYTTTAVTAGSPISVGSAASTATGCVIGLDAASPPTAYIFWASGAVSAASDINYVKVASPYTSATAATNLSNNSAHDNGYPHLPVQTTMTGVVPVLYAYTVSPWTIAYDNSITLTVALSGAGTITEHAALSASGNVAGAAAGVITGHAHLSASPIQVQNASARIQGQGTLSATTGTHGTGIGDIVRSTGTQYANRSGNGYGAGDVSGTAYDYRYTDSTGSGWAIEANPWYGGMPASGWYQIDPTLNATLPQRTSATGNLMSLLTTQSGGIVHWEELAGAYQASELPTFQNTGNFTELAPANTPFRAYIKAVGDAPDSNGISWTSYMCVYPGDPGLVVFRFDQSNKTASAISVSESDIELIASLLADNGANPKGIWNPANGFTGKVGGAITTGWPSAGAHQAGTFDFAGITPNAGSGIILGTGAAVLQDPSVQFGWASSGYEMNESAASTTNPTRIKFGFYSGTSPSWTIPAGQTNTYYVLRVFQRNLTSASMAAIAADFKYPGTPSVTVGSYTQFVVDERAYQFAATNNQVTATLDLSNANVTVRYKPVLKITNWTAGGAPTLSWGGTALAAGADYRYYNDTANTTLYVQLYFDVAKATPQTGQRANATLNVQGALSGAATITGHGTFTANNKQTLAVTGTILEHASLSASGQVLGAGSASVQGHGKLSARATQIHYGAATVQSHGQLNAIFSPNRSPTVLQSHATLQATGSVATPLPQTPLTTTAVLAIVDNITKALLDLQTAFSTNIVTTTPTLATMQAGIQQLPQRIAGFYDITQEAALGPAAMASAKQALQFLGLNQTNFYALYGPVVTQLDAYLGGLSAYLVQQGLQVHPQFAALFNYLAQNAPMLQLANAPLTPISPRSIFLTNPMTLGTLTYQGVAKGAYSLQARVDTTSAGDAPLSLKNIGVSTIGAGTSVVVTYQQWDGTTHTLTYMLQAALTSGATQTLPVSGVACSSLTPTASGAGGNALAIIAVPLRTVSY